MQAVDICEKSSPSLDEGHERAHGERDPTLAEIAPDAAVHFFGGGARTIMTSLVVYVATPSLTFAARFASGRWKELDLVGSEPTV